jgi:hypothetical protein
MNPKTHLILCLAVALSGGLSGCSTAAEPRGDGEISRSASATEVILKFVKADSEETEGQNGRGTNAVDGDPNTYWHTRWQGKCPGLPHEIVLELIPPATIQAFSYLPRQDESDHGTIKNFEFYVSKDGTHFGAPVKKGAFDADKKENIETFAPVKCRFVKLRALSEINGLPWTSAAEIRVIRCDEEPVPKDYWRGNAGQTAVPQDSARPNALDSFLQALAADHGLWMNGTDAIRPSSATTPEEVVSETFRYAKFPAGVVTRYRIIDVRKVHLDVIADCTAALVDTDLGQMIFVMQYVEGNDSQPGYWWRRIYDASSQIKRLY